ncbi:hypothetical protein Hamer_G025726 [Homarus americanus]|uniref:Uncharacterized protein n=1 Tax=Homarus americanus TaxID=6706 RepID=A0A8J5JKX2_HOMAM|nr:hypothetical protein Hamer_G025726 [Homarus americanus]
MVVVVVGVVCSSGGDVYLVHGEVREGGGGGGGGSGAAAVVADRLRGSKKNNKRWHEGSCGRWICGRICGRMLTWMSEVWSEVWWSVVQCQRLVVQCSLYRGSVVQCQRFVVGQGWRQLPTPPQPEPTLEEEKRRESDVTKEREDVTWKESDVTWKERESCRMLPEGERVMLPEGERVRVGYSEGGESVGCYLKERGMLPGRRESESESESCGMLPEGERVMLPEGEREENFYL